MLHEFNAGAPRRRETTRVGQRDKNFTPRRSGRRGNDRDRFDVSRIQRRGAGPPGNDRAGQRDKNLSPRRSERRGNTEKYLFQNFRWLRQEMRRQRIGSMLHEFNAGAPRRRETTRAGSAVKVNAAVLGAPGEYREIPF